MPGIIKRRWDRTLKRMAVLVFIILPLALSAGCKKPSGVFAFRTPMEDSYHRIEGPVEVDSEKELQWAFVVSNLMRRMDVGVNYLKKELSWVEVLASVDYVSPDKPAIHGAIKGFEPGSYRLMLVDISDRNNVLGTLDFLIYTEEEE